MLKFTETQKTYTRKKVCKLNQLQHPSSMLRTNWRSQTHPKPNTPTHPPRDVDKGRLKNKHAPEGRPTSTRQRHQDYGGHVLESGVSKHKETLTCQHHNSNMQHKTPMPQRTRNYQT